MKNKITASSLFFLYFALLASGLLQAIISGYLNIFLKDFELRFPPDLLKALFQTFLHVNIPQIVIPVKDILTGAIVGLLGMLIGLYFRKAFNFR